MKFNLIVTTYRHKEEEVKNELSMMLKKLGDDCYTIIDSNISGMVFCNTNLDIFKVIEEFKKIIHNEPWEFRFILRVIPIEIVVLTEIDLIVINVEKMVKERILHNMTYKIVIEKRHTNFKSKDLIDKIASRIDSKVSLDYPDKIILVEIIGQFTGISIIDENQIFSNIKEKKDFEFNVES